MSELLTHVVESLIFAFVGVAVLAVTFLVIVKVMPFSVRKEIEEDQNTALGVMLGCLFLGISVIIAAAVH